MLKFSILILIGMLAGVANGQALKLTVANAEFESEAAKKAMEKYQDRMSSLQSKLAEQTREARDTLKEELSDALTAAASGRDFAETQRLSKLMAAWDSAFDSEADQIKALKLQLKESQKGSVTILMQKFNQGRRSYHVLMSDGSILPGNGGTSWSADGNKLTLIFGKYVDQCELLDGGKRYLGVNSDGTPVGGVLLFDGLGIGQMK